MLSTVRFHEVAQKRGPRALEIAREIAEHDEPDIVRLTAAKFLIERGYGRDDCGIDVTQAKEVRVFLGTREEREQLESQNKMIWREPDDSPVFRHLEEQDSHERAHAGPANPNLIKLDELTYVPKTDDTEEAIRRQRRERRMESIQMVLRLV